MELPLQTKSDPLWEAVHPWQRLLLLATLIGTPLLALLLYRETDLTRQLFPVVIGVLVQSVAILLLLRLNSSQMELRRKRGLKFALRTFLGTAIYLNLAPKGSPRAAEQFLASPDSLPNLMESLRIQGLDPAGCERLWGVAQREGPGLRALLAMAALLDYDHLDAWSCILGDLAQLEGNGSPEETRRLALAVMESIQRFDQLPLSGAGT